MMSSFGNGFSQRLPLRILVFPLFSCAPWKCCERGWQLIPVNQQRSKPSSKGECFMKGIDRMDQVDQDDIFFRVRNEIASNLSIVEWMKDFRVLESTSSFLESFDWRVGMQRSCDWKWTDQNIGPRWHRPSTTKKGWHFLTCLDGLFFGIYNIFWYIYIYMYYILLLLSIQ